MTGCTGMGREGPEGSDGKEGGRAATAQEGDPSCDDEAQRAGKADVIVSQPLVHEQDHGLADEKAMAEHRACASPTLAA